MIEEREKNTETQIMVSVCCLVYNHEPFLRDCFESFVMQQTTFPIEILVHDDASTDHSADIIREYTAKYPDLFKPIYQTENQYSQGKGFVGMTLNFERAKGKYIAMCEGDDYWIDPLKLQKQVDFMEKHSDVSYMFTKNKRLAVDGIMKDFDARFPQNIPDVFDLHYLIKNKMPVPPTQTICFRKDCYPEKMPEFNFKVIYGDVLTLYMVAHHHKIGFIDECTAVYREGVGIISRSNKKDLIKLGRKLNSAINKLTNYEYNYFLGDKSFYWLQLYQLYRPYRKYYPIAYFYYVAWQISKNGFNAKNIMAILRNTFKKFGKIKNLCH